MSIEADWHFERDAQDIGWLIFDMAGKSANILNRQTVAGLAAQLDRIEAEDGLAGLGLLSGKPGGFVYGADINEFAELKTSADITGLIAHVTGLLTRIEALDCPTAVGIDGLAVGGGLELALCFDRLFVTENPKTALGFPEITLGLLPGYGGSGRSTARIGAAAALDMMLSGRPVPGAAALASGLADQPVKDGESLRGQMASWMQGCGGQKPARPQQPDEDVAAACQAAAEKYLGRVRSDHMPAGQAIITHMESCRAEPEALIAAEARLFAELMLGEASDGLRRVFQLRDAVRKTSRGESGIASVHVIGAGVMGGDIAAVAAMAGLSVTLTDMDEAVIEAARERAKKLFERRLKDAEKAEAALQRLQADPDSSGAGEADLIIEAVAEKLEVKQQVFAALEKQAKAGAILATNTSAIPLEDIASVLDQPERLIGIHFFNPVPVLPLVEIIWSARSDQDLIKRAMCFVGQLGKMPVRCKSAPGFLVNRALLPYMYKAVAAVADGADADRIDTALVDFGMPMGPIELCDQVGLDVCYQAGQMLDMPQAAAASFQAKLAAGEKGRKTGSGFYQWDGNQAVRPRQAASAEEMQAIAEDMLAPMVAECRAAVADGVVDAAAMADAGMIFGTGFPGFRGGPLHWADKKGL